MGLNKRERGGEGAGGATGGATPSVRGNYKSFKGINVTVSCGRNEPVYHVYPVSRTTSEEKAECSRGWGSGGGCWAKGFLTALGRIYVEVCYMRGARSRRAGGGEGGGVGRGRGGDELELRHGCSLYTTYCSGECRCGCRCRVDVDVSTSQKHNNTAVRIDRVWFRSPYNQGGVGCEMLNCKSSQSTKWQTCVCTSPSHRDSTR